jgi:hypothetical protein
LVDNIEGMASVSPGEGGRDVDVEFGVVDPEAEVAFGFGLRFGFGFWLVLEIEAPAEKFLPPPPPIPPAPTPDPTECNAAVVWTILEGILFKPKIEAGRFFLLETPFSCSRVSIASWSCFWDSPW